MTNRFEPVEFTAARSSDGEILNALSVDVEDYYHAHALASYFTRDTWPGLERRVVANTTRILDALEAKGLHATFFTLGSVALEFPDLIRDIVGRGHELASHGMAHYRASDQTRDEFFRDVSRAKAVLEDAGGVEVSGYRAPSFSITPDNWWAFDVLEDAGYRYSSSISTGHLGHGNLQVPAQPFRPGAGHLVECPILSMRFMGRSVPTGGGYFRLMPYQIFRRSLRAAQRLGALPATFYYHPWEIDPDQPRAKVGAKTRFRHLVNVRHMENKVDRLTRDFPWATMRDVFSPAILG